MRMPTFACTLAVAIGIAATAHAADVYATPPHPARAAVMPPRYAAVVPIAPVVERPLGIVTVPQGWAYVVPQPAYQAGHEYVQSPVLLDSRHHRRCWHEWGQLRCAVWGW